jgi:hypothetical protein
LAKRPHGGVGVARGRTYEITFVGQAGPALRAAFSDLDVTVGSGTTTLRGDLPDQAALHGVIERLAGLGLELLDVHPVPPSPDN